MSVVKAGKLKTVDWSLRFALSPKLLSMLNCASAYACLWSPISHLPFFGHPILMRIIFSIVIVLPTRPLDIALYLEHFIESDTSASILSHASCGISWANKLYGFSHPWVITVYTIPYNVPLYRYILLSLLLEVL